MTAVLGLLALPFATAADRHGSPATAAGGRGRDARRPSEIPARGWMDILVRLWREQSRDNIPVIAAGVAYYMLLSLVPAITAMVSLYGLVADPATVERQLRSVGGILPDQARQIVFDQLSAIVSAPRGGLSLGLAVAVGIALWSASVAMQNLITALNVAYEEEERRSYPRFVALALALTLGALLFVPLALALVAVVPAIVGFLPLGRVGETVVQAARWPILVGLVMTALAVLYRFGPCRARPRWRWVSWGAVAATILWVLVSAGFSVYVRSVADYNATYGSLGAVVVLLFWFWLTAYAVLLGAELNAEIEHQTARDTTTGPERPLGARRAFVADTIGAPADRA